MANESKVEIIIEGKNRSADAFKQVDSQLAGLQGSIGGLVKGAGLAALAAGLIEVGKAAFEMGREAAGVMELRGAFDDLAVSVGQSSDEMLTAMRAASNGLISDAQLVGTANKAILMGVADNASEMASLMEVALARGDAMGLSAAAAADMLVEGLGKMSGRMLINLGITMDEVKIFEDYARELGRTAEQLTEAEKKQSLLNAVIAGSAQVVADAAERGDSLADKFERMDASIANAKQALGEMFAPAVAVIAQQLADAVTSLMHGLDQTGVDEMATGLIDRYKAVEEAQAKAAFASPEWIEQQIVLNNLYEQIVQLYGAAGVLAPTMADLASKHKDLSIASIAAIGAALDLAESQRWLSAGFQGTAQEAAALRGQILDLVAAERAVIAIADAAKSALESSFKGKVSELGVAGAMSGFQAANAEVQATIISLKAQGKTQEEIDFTVAGIVDRWRDVNSQLGKTTTAVAQVDKAFEDLKSKVASVLSGALNVDVGVNADDLLPRQDAINEDARRLADVAVNGFASPWADYLNTKFPGMFGEAFEGGDIKTKAAQLLKDFEDGLNPQLIDKDKAKERVKRMILGEASMAELAAQVTAELQAEMGGNAPADLAAKVSQAIGGKGTGGAETGADFAGTTLDAVITSDVGGNMVATVINQAAGKAALVKTGGESTGKLWGTSVLTGAQQVGVPEGLIALLIGVLWPKIEAKQAEQKTRTGTVEAQ